MAASSNVSSSPITINASELASVLNRHRYQPRSETMLKVWQKADMRTFCLAKGLEFRDEIARLIHSQTGKTKEALNSVILFDKWDQDDESFIKVMKDIFPDSKDDLYWNFSHLRKKILNELRALTLRNYKEQKILEDSHIHRIELIQEVKKLAENEKKPVSESVKEFCEKKGIKDEKVAKAIESTVTKDRGTKLESKAVEVFGEKNNVEFIEVDIDILQSKQMECDGIKWILQGRADALMEDTVVEVKNRKNRFMVPLPEYDWLQLQAYLFLYNKEIGILLERMNEENKETAVEFDVEQWMNKVIPGMRAFVVELNNIIVKNKERFADPDNHCMDEESTTSTLTMVEESITNTSQSPSASVQEPTTNTFNNLSTLAQASNTDTSQSTLILVEESIKNKCKGISTSVQESVASTSPSKRSNEDSDNPVQEKKKCLPTVIPTLPQQDAKHDLHCSNSSVQDEKFWKESGVSAQGDLEDNVDANKKEEPLEDSDDTWWNKYV